MDVRVAAAGRRPRAGRGLIWLARLTLAYAVVAVAGSWFALVASGSFDLQRAAQASLSAAVATLPLAVLVLRFKLEGTLR